LGFSLKFVICHCCSASGYNLAHNDKLTSGGLEPKPFKKAPGIFKCTYAENRSGISCLVERQVCANCAAN
jgi:hypothetical protein